MLTFKYQIAKGVFILNIKDFLTNVLENNEDIAGKIFYVCNFVPNSKNLLKNVNSNVRPTKIKFKKNVVAMGFYDFTYTFSEFICVMKGDKELSKKIEIYNLNSLTFLYIFEDKYKCLEKYLELQQEYLDNLDDIVGLKKKTYYKEQQQLRDSISDI